MIKPNHPLGKVIKLSLAITRLLFIKIFREDVKRIVAKPTCCLINFLWLVKIFNDWNDLTSIIFSKTIDISKEKVSLYSNSFSFLCFLIFAFCNCLIMLVIHPLLLMICCFVLWELSFNQYNLHSNCCLCNPSENKEIILLSRFWLLIKIVNESLTILSRIVYISFKAT